MARKLAANVQIDGQFFKAGSTPPKEYADQITNPKAWSKSTGKADKEPAADPDADSDYDSMKKDELEAEVEKRNEDRDEGAQIVVGEPGHKADIIEALEADDLV